LQCGDATRLVLISETAHKLRYFSRRLRRELFERLLALTNDVGLLAEEYDPRSRRQLGNFPQAFSHVALINTALNLCREEKPVEQRADKKAA